MLTLRKGDHGEAVEHLQRSLAAKGFSPGPIDGDFGSRTDRSVRQFQAAYGLKVDGLVGDRTWGHLLAGAATPSPAELVAQEKAELLALLQDADIPDEVASVLQAAIDSLGWREQPDGSNGGPEVDLISTDYYSAAYEAEHGKPPWCALALCYWMKEGLGAESYKDIPFGARFGAVKQIEDWAKANGRFHKALASSPAPVGSIFTMARKGSSSDPSEELHAGHAGFILADLGTEVVTIEGNTHNAVLRRVRRKTSFRGWASWW